MVARTFFSYIRTPGSLVCMMLLAVAAAAEQPELPDGDALIAEIAAETDLFALHDMKMEYEKREEKSQAVEDALLKRRDELVAAHERQTAIDGSLDLILFEFKKIDGEEHVLRWYYVVNDDIAQDWILKAALRVDKSHVNMLPEDATHRDRGLLNLRIAYPSSKINTWSSGEHRVISLNRQLKTIPYNITSYFYLWEGNREIPAATLRHGWHADL